MDPSELLPDTQSLVQSIVDRDVQRERERMLVLSAVASALDGVFLDQPSGGITVGIDAGAVRYTVTLRKDQQAEASP